MRIRITGVPLGLDEDESDLPRVVARRLSCDPGAITDLRVLRRSLDARRRRGQPPFFTHVVELDYGGARMPRGRRPGEIVPVEPEPVMAPLRWHRPSEPRPVVVGAGPAGLAAAWILAEAGARPLVVERGEAAEDRASKVRRFWNEGTLDGESNVLYGEGGAGLFSDGKLTARSKDRGRIGRFLELLVACGAPEEILREGEAHLGSDLLLRLVPALRRRIEGRGGEFRWSCPFEDLRIEEGNLRALRIGGEWLEASRCILATGHSARDAIRLLARRGVPMEAKPMAVGLRLELPQRLVDRGRYGRWAGHPRLGAASFRVTRRAGGELRACYSFCMCPGGEVIACASSPEELTTNGMSLSLRDGPWANAAFLVGVGPEDYLPYADGDARLAGLAFQEDLEGRVFRCGGADYGLPASPLEDFLAGRSPRELPSRRSCLRAVPADLAGVLPAEVLRTIRGSVLSMLGELGPIPVDEVLLYGAETRSSSPVRILRDEEGESPGCRGLLPAGEGGGHAGGIVSSAIDGMRAAERLLSR